jgi:Flp pilus assembly protein TadD
VACALGMASKETMATAPLMVVLFDRTFNFATFSQALRTRMRFYLSLAGTWLLLAALSWQHPRAGSAGFSTSITPWTYLLNQSMMVVRYLRLAAWPRPLVFDYGVPKALSLAQAAPYGAAVVALLAITIAALVWNPPIGFPGAWFFIILAPTSSIIPVASEVGAESRMYLPLAAIIVLAVTGAHRLLQRSRLPPIAAIAITAVVCAGFAAATAERNAEYHSGIALWRTVVARWPHARAHRNLAQELKGVASHDDVIAEWREVVREEPDSRYELGRELFADGKLEEAAVELRRFVAEYPADEAVSSARRLIAMAVSSEGKAAEAVQAWRDVLKDHPADAEAEQALADALFAQDKYGEARTQYENLVKLKPDDDVAWNDLAIALDATDQPARAGQAFEKAVDLNPQNERAQLGLATALLRQNDAAGAASHSETAIRLAPGDGVAHATLGLALLVLRNIDGAVTEFRKSLEIDPADAQTRSFLTRAENLRHQKKGGPSRGPALSVPRP